MMNPFRLRRSSTKRTTIPRPLKSGQTYRLWLVTSRTPPYGQKEELAMFKTNLAGAQVAQAVGPFRQVLTSKSEKNCRAGPEAVPVAYFGRERRRGTYREGSRTVMNIRRLIMSPSCLKQEPGPAFGLVYPNLDQARGGDVPMLVADVVRFAKTCCQRLVVPR